MICKGSLGCLISESRLHPKQMNKMSIDNILERVIMQASMAPKKSRSPRRRKYFFSSSKGTISSQQKQLQESLASCKVDKDVTIIDNEEKQERCVTDLPSISLDSMQPKNHDLDARHKVMKMLQLFTSVR
jgi:hypothetical protein